MTTTGDHVIETIIAVEPPEPGTDAMVTLISDVIGEAFSQLREMFPFTNGDCMSACMHLLVDAGLQSAWPERLREDVIKGVDGVLAERAAQRQKAN